MEAVVDGGKDGAVGVVSDFYAPLGADSGLQHLEPVVLE